MIKMFKITIDQYENIVTSMIENLNLNNYENDATHDHIESIDMHFKIESIDNRFVKSNDVLIIDNIESLYDAINDLIETIRIQRYVDIKYKRDYFVSFEYDDEIRIVRTSNDYMTQTTIETITIETIDEFEKQNKL